MKALMMGSPYAKVHGIYRGLGNGFRRADFATLRILRSCADDSAVGNCENNQMDNGRVI